LAPETRNADVIRVFPGGETRTRTGDTTIFLADTFTNVHGVVDGRALSGLSAFRFASPLYLFSPVAGNVFGIPAAVNSPSVADGYWVMLDKLKKGTHTVSFGGEAPAFGFVTETRYTLTVG
jgi:hypothetical protein